MEMVTRRSFLRAGAAAVGGMTGTVDRAGKSLPKESSFIDLLRLPDAVTTYGGFQKTVPWARIALERNGVQWRGGQVVVECVVEQNALVLTLAAPSDPMVAVHVRWAIAGAVGDSRPWGRAWERSYGELGWRGLIPGTRRDAAWYLGHLNDGTACHGYGVKTDRGRTVLLAAGCGRCVTVAERGERR